MVGTALPRVGDVVAGKYRVERFLAKGGMGAIFECEHTYLSQRVALKVLTDLTQPDAVGRFLNEARAAARIQSDHVVRVFDFGIWGDEGTPYLVMEMLNGVDLDALLRARRTLDIPEAVDTMLETLEALAQAHALGIVHRDLKPANLFVATRPGVAASVKVLDFGISKASHALGSEAPVYTSSKALLGSPLYMSPEQLRNSRQIDGRADLWSIGVILHEVLGGRPPFNAQHLGELLTAVLEGEVPPLRARRPDVPAPLEAIVGRCLERGVEARFASASELAEALAPFGAARAAAALQKIRAQRATGGKMVGSAPAGPAEGPSSLPAFVEASTASATPPQVTAGGGWHHDNAARGRGRRAALVAAGLAVSVALLAGMGMVAVTSGRRAPKGIDGDAPSAPLPASAVASVPPMAGPVGGQTPVAGPVASASPSATLPASSASAAPPHPHAVRPGAPPAYDPYSGPRR
jgi:serine/threonine-protein kinase